MEELAGKVAVVTGAASGIGLALSRALSAEGMKVVLADIEDAALDAAVAGFPDGAEVLAVHCDVSDPAAVDALRDAAVERFGTVHVVANNAGVSTGGPVWSHTPEDWEWVLGVNLYGVVNGVRSFAPLLIEQGEGHIVNTASMAGLSSPPFMGVYNVSKHAVVTLSETLFGDLALAGAEGVGVSVLCPGWVQTRIHEAARNRPDAPEEDPDGAAAGFAEVAAALIASGLEPDDVAQLVVDAIRTRRFYILTHPEWKPMISGRVEHILSESDPIIAGLPE
ncbi:MAG TPA: SDR family NAD(P)-dependent oxidoreductase [Acidimicrobiales bacterium]|nr:SDR family NAD(P)-dependent oxidoreductase [Acidimicrobiales bacterium]HMS89918.1 SDR family NAD(P)-dependent oxidoreductase [Acidimicrobiales bacterium]HRA33706.1 SDR family NAD(P)-dependent oxidoreductase [Acidimicrobiales bacterium]